MARRQRVGVDVFVSYARADVAAVRRLTDDIELGGHQVWFDRDLHGGEDWWRQILQRIRACSVLVLALSQDALRSQACRAEVDYAEALGVPVIPIQVGPVESLTATQVAGYQVIDYRQESSALGFRVMRAFTEGAARRGPLPEPLPPEPEVPFAYLSTLARQIAQPELRSTEQAAVVGQLRHALRHENDEDARADARRLLTELRGHPACTYANAQEIDTILAGPDRQDEPGGGPGPAARRRWSSAALPAVGRRRTAVVGTVVVLLLLTGAVGWFSAGGGTASGGAGPTASPTPGLPPPSSGQPLPPGGGQPTGTSPPLVSPDGTGPVPEGWTVSGTVADRSLVLRVPARAIPTYGSVYLLLRPLDRVDHYYRGQCTTDAGGAGWVCSEPRQESAVPTSGGGYRAIVVTRISAITVKDGLPTVAEPDDQDVVSSVTLTS